MKAEFCCSVVTVLSCKVTEQLWGKAWSQLPAVSLEQHARLLQTCAILLFVSKWTQPLGALSLWLPAARKQIRRGRAVPVHEIAAKGSTCGAFVLYVTGTSSGVIVLDLSCLSHALLPVPQGCRGVSNGTWVGEGSVDAAFGPESSTRDSFETVPCNCCAGLCGYGNKSPGGWHRSSLRHGEAR